MSGGTLWSEATATGSRAVALALGAGFVLRFLKWLLEFVFRRLDVNRSHLGRRFDEMRVELDAYREATMLMIGVVAKLDPNNAALLKVSQLLRSTAPRASLDLDEIVRRMSEIPGTEKRGVK